MTIFAEMTRTQVAHWLHEYGQEIACARDEFIEAARKYGAVLEKRRGAFERDPMTAALFVEHVMDRADSPLSDELKRDMDL